MNEYLKDTSQIIIPACYETIYMVFFSSIFSIFIGGIFGIILFLTKKNGLMQNLFINKTLGTIINILRSIPFVILIIAVFPVARFIVGTSIGSTAAIVPLTIATFPFAARIIESSLNEVNKGVIEASISMGSSNTQIVTKVIIPEALSSIIEGITLIIISIIGCSAMAGMVGGGGLGDVANRYGAQRYRFDILAITIVIMVIFVQTVQFLGNFLAKKFNK